MRRKRLVRNVSVFLESLLTLPGISQFIYGPIGWLLTAIVSAYVGRAVSDSKPDWDFIWSADLYILTWSTIVGMVLWGCAALYRWQSTTVSSSLSDHKVALSQLSRLAFDIADDLEDPVTRETKWDAKTLKIMQAVDQAYKSIEGICVTFYKYKEVNRRKTILDPIHSFGERTPSGPFVSGTPRGDYALNFVRGPAEAMFVPDRTFGGEEWEGSGKGYVTYISCPVSSTSGIFGMITIDAPNVGDLNSDDQKVVEMAAGLLSAALTPIGPP